jgi:proline iminopeptidase
LQLCAPKTNRIMKNRTFAGIAALTAAGVYAAVLRPRMLHWGATQEEIDAPFPGQDIIPNGSREMTMAITIDAPPKNVWAYLTQMGLDRAGWYSWDRLDNWGKHSADRVHPEWQQARQGQHFNAMPDGSEWWEVARVVPEQLLILRMSVDLRGKPFDTHARKPKYFTDSTWGFQLKPIPGGRTRLIVSGYWEFQPSWLQPLLTVTMLEPSHWIMQMKQFKNLKRMAERDARKDFREAKAMVEAAETAW